MEIEITEKPKQKPSWVPVKFPHKMWTINECASFEQFVKENSAEIRRIFIKYGIGVQHHG